LIRIIRAIRIILDMIILGIDPGTHRAGYGFIKSTGGACQYLAAGTVPVHHREPHLKLQDIKKGTEALIAKFRPAGIAIEKLYITRNQKTGISVAEARGVFLLTAAEHNLPLAEFGPGEVKAHLTGYGSADKRSIAKMVRLCLRCPDLAVVDDATDALAVALAAHYTKAFEKRGGESLT
jgi:crossover junction endodeoxyribonuclease RuvC